MKRKGNLFLFHAKAQDNLRSSFVFSSNSVAVYPELYRRTHFKAYHFFCFAFSVLFFAVYPLACFSTNKGKPIADESMKKLEDLKWFISFNKSTRVLPLLVGVRGGFLEFLCLTHFLLSNFEYCIKHFECHFSQIAHRIVKILPQHFLILFV